MERRTFIRTTAGAAVIAALSGKHFLAAANSTASRTPATVDAVRGNGEKVTLRGAQIQELRGALRGRLLLPKSEGYEEARLTRNPTIDKYPGLIVQATGVADVRAAVDFARENRLLVAVKCGGHSSAGFSTCDGGMMIDLSGMNAVRVDPVAKKAWVAGGTLLGLLDRQAMAYDLVTPMGTASDTGVGGLTTGGGFGRVARRFGLALDNVTGLDVVTADGKIRHASATENPDLFWGARGGGGNFGVVTTFEFQLHPMRQKVVAGGVRFPFTKTRDVLDFYADYSVAAPDELYVDFSASYQAGNTDGMLALQVCYSGDERSADKVLAPVRRLADKTSDDIRLMDYVSAQGSNELPNPRLARPGPRLAEGGTHANGLVTEINSELVTAIVDNLKPHPRHSTSVYFQHAGGAIGRVRNDATAFSHRYATHSMLAGVRWKGEASVEDVRSARQLQELKKYTRGFYVNDMSGDEGAAAISANYEGNHPRLVEIKNKYDPGNLFRLNANVKPTAS